MYFRILYYYLINFHPPNVSRHRKTTHYQNKNPKNTLNT